MIAEHDPVDIELTHNELKNSGMVYESQVVQNENDYLQALKAFNPDIILADYTFPSFDGPTAFRIRQELAPQTPFIFLSGTIGEERSIELIKTGVTDYCLKDKLFALNHKVLRALRESKAEHQKRQVEHKLIHSEMRLARAQQVAHLGNWEYDFLTKDLSWSDEIFRIHGLYPSQDRQSPEFALSFIHGEDVVSMLKKFKVAHISPVDFSSTYRIILREGSIRYLYIEGKPELDPVGKIIGIYGIVHDVTETVMLENKVAEERATRQKEITDAVLTAQETERAEIGKELHDNLNQILGAAKLYIELAISDGEIRHKCLQKSSEYITDVIEQIRNISKRIVIPSANAMGLFDCIRILKSDLALIHPIKILFDVEGIDDEELGEKLQLNIYRIIQEQVNNILKHSKATKATINIRRRGHEIILLISDNGRGYDTTKLRKGVGIRNIMSRAELLHGKAEINSKTGKGYQLRVELPYERVSHRSSHLATSRN